MFESKRELIARKLKATVLAVFLYAMAWSSWDIYTDTTILYRWGEHFTGMTMFYFFYIGCFVLTYGNLLSLIVEFCQRKWFAQADWLYVLLLSIGGSAIGLLFPAKSFIIAGMGTAAFYGIFDKWLLKK